MILTLITMNNKGEESVWVIDLATSVDTELSSTQVPVTFSILFTSKQCLD